MPELVATYYEFEPSGPDTVYVELRKYNERDIILECRVRVDGDYVVESRKVLDNGVRDFDAIREAIKTYDQLVADHPANDCKVNWQEETDDIAF